MFYQEWEKQKMRDDIAQLKASLATVNAEQASLAEAMQTAKAAYDAARQAHNAAVQAHVAWQFRQSAARNAVANQSSLMSKASLPLPH